MLEIIVEGKERFDDEKEEFIPALAPHTLKLEHSLISISKWEEQYHKPFLATRDKDQKMIIDYIKCMTLNTVPDKVYEYITPEIINKVADYILDSHTASWISGSKENPNRSGTLNGETITSELVYFWMINLQIPVEFQKWHLSRLLMLIQIISIKNDPKASKGHKMTAAERTALNKARQKKYGIRG